MKLLILVIGLVLGTSCTIKMSEDNGAGTEIALQKASLTSYLSKDTITGIDISKYQGGLAHHINKSDHLTFVICKASQGAHHDPNFKDNWITIKEKKLIRGAYHMFDTDFPDSVQVEIFSAQLVELHDLDFPPILDVEQGSPENPLIDPTLEVSVVQEHIHGVLQKLEIKLGRIPMIYANAQDIKTYLDHEKFARYPIWFAHYSSDNPPLVPGPWQNIGWTIWQRTDHKNIQDIEVDYDLFNGSLEEMYDFIRKSKSKSQLIFNQ